MEDINEQEKKVINALRAYFRVTCLGFEFGRNIQAVLGNKPLITQMEHLHSMALCEIEKDKPNMLLINKLLEQMELLAEQNYTNNGTANN